MSRTSGVRRLLRLPRGRARAAADLDDELTFHFEAAVRDLVARGLDADAARAEARRRFGDLAAARAAMLGHDQRRLSAERWSNRREALVRDVAFGLRLLLARPGFTAVVVLTLGVAIAVNTAVFGAVNALLLRPLPFTDPDRLVVVWGQERAASESVMHLSIPETEDWRRESTVFAGLAAYPHATGGTSLAGAGEPIQVQAMPVSANFFQVLGAGAALGRALVAEDDAPGAAPVAVLSHGLWRTAFGGDSGIVGRTLRLDDRALTVVGVMPPAIDFPRGAELWVPFRTALPEYIEDRKIGFLRLVGRLEDGVSADRARDDLARVTATVRGRYPASSRSDAAVVTPLERHLIGHVRPALLALAGAAAVILLLACGNVTNLMLARATTREREMAVRVALGAGRGALVRQMLVEGTLLALAGGALGLLLAIPAAGALRALLPPAVPRVGDIRVDAAVLAFAAGLTLATPLLFALLPAWRAAGEGLAATLRAGTRGTASVASHRLLAGLVVAEVALALVLLLAAGLLGRSLARLTRVDLGFQPAGLLTAQLAPPATRYASPPSQRALLDVLLPELRALPGVTGAAAVLLRPLEGATGYDFPFSAEGQDSATAARNPLLNFEAVSPRYFRTMSLPLIAGRDFGPADADSSPPVVIVSRGLARRLWPGEEPLGKRMKLPGSPRWRAVVGVAADARYRDVREPSLDVYVPYTQSPFVPQFLVVRTLGDPSAIAPLLRARVRAIDPEIPVARVATMEEQFARELAQPRFTALLFGVLAGTALLLAALGLYGVLAYAVADRSREIGIRMALGALPAGVRADVIRRALALVGAGVVLGLAPALAGGWALSGMLFGVRVLDPLTLVLVPAVLLCTAILASYVPARRATSVDPLVSLRAD